LAGRPRGRRPGEQKALGAMQEARLRDLIARGVPINSVCGLRCGRAQRCGR
jgi:hypothetical protein